MTVVEFCEAERRHVIRSVDHTTVTIYCVEQSGDTLFTVSNRVGNFYSVEGSGDRLYTVLNGREKRVLSLSKAVEQRYLLSRIGQGSANTSTERSTETVFELPNRARERLLRNIAVRSASF